MQQRLAVGPMQPSAGMQLAALFHSHDAHFEVVSRPVLIKVRIGTERDQGKQIHSGILWTLEIPEMLLLSQFNVVQIFVL